MNRKRIFVIIGIMFIFVTAFLWSYDYIFYKINQDQYVILQANAIEKTLYGIYEVFLVVEYEIDGKQMTGKVVKPLGVNVGDSLEIAVNLSGGDIVIPRLYISKYLLVIISYDVIFLSVFLQLFSEKKNVYSIWNKEK